MKIRIFFHLNNEDGRLAALDGEVRPGADYLHFWDGRAVPSIGQLVRINRGWRRVEDVGWTDPDKAYALVSAEVSAIDTSLHDRAIKEIDRRYMLRLLDSCDANYDELPQGLKNVLGQLRTAGFRGRLYEMKTQGGGA